MKLATLSGTLVIIAAAALLVGCSQPGAEPGQQQQIIPVTPPEVTGFVTRAVAVLHPVGDSGVTGTVTFEEVGDGVKVTADISGLEPGEHGFHIHQYGDCTAADATSAGGHFNPEEQPHGAPSDQQRHVGDLGNIAADGSSQAHYELTDSVIALSGAHSIIGRGIIVHAGRDDLTSQPTGDAGGRVACGVIGIASD